MRPQAGFGGNAQPPQWQLFELAQDRGETTDLAAARPETVQRLKAAWLTYAERVGVVFPAH
ncbi:hypothetical protein D3C79_1121630 [compost metagenome]